MYMHLNKAAFDQIYQTLTKKERKAVDVYMATIIQPMLEKEQAVEEAKKKLL